MRSFSASRPIVVFGCGGHGRVIADILGCKRAHVAGFLDDNPPGPIVDGVPVIGDHHSLVEPDFLAKYAIIIGVGESALRRHLALQVLYNGGSLAIAVHPRATIARRVSLGAGTVVMAGAVINTGSRVGRFAVVNTGATVDHDCVLEDGVHISPGCHLSGAVVCDVDVFVGTGAAVIPRVRIGARAVIGAGATVIADVPPEVLATGCPARVKKRLAIS
jgi:sugar O-acyltransferase (sialic acid O-acetyltransferase NeuD family)